MCIVYVFYFFVYYDVLILKNLLLGKRLLLLILRNRKEAPQHGSVFERQPMNQEVTV